MFLTLRRVWSLFGDQGFRYGTAIAALVVATCFLYAAPLIPQAVFDGVLSSDPNPSASTRAVVSALGGRAYVAENLWLPALVFLVLSAIAGGFTYLRARWAADASQQIVRRVRDEIYDHLQHLACTYFDSAETGDLVQRCTSDVETLRKFLASQVVEIGRAVIMLIVPIPLLIAIDWRMTAVSLVLLPLITCFSYFVFRRIKQAFLLTDEAEGALTARITENLSGIRVARAFARQEHEEALFEAINAKHRGLDFQLYSHLAKFWAISDLLCFLQKGLVVAAGAYWLMQGSLAVGAFFYFLAAVNLFLFPMRHMGRILADLGKAVVAIERLDEVLTQARELDPDGAPTPVLTGDLDFDRVSFSHGELAVLNEVSFSVPAGQTLAILGPSGSGKSTLVNLLLRLYDYEQGSIRLGGHELSSLPRKHVRRQVAVVLQEPFLFSKTIGENVRLGRADATQEDVETATRAAGIHETILGFESGYETAVGERGVTLSGGQRQRLALARALLERPVVLVLDDSLSAVDTETEATILDALAATKGRQTTIVIAHRVSTIKDADQILVLGQGRVVQAGDHESLLAEDGPYARLWAAQTNLSLGSLPAVPADAVTELRVCDLADSGEVADALLPPLAKTA
ncbi:MAG: ABC transporter ATP-binding protein [Planctomycetes bacterium]|nr:ABC transporter ATP-binding protein [Planctomycetota bacterium]